LARRGRYRWATRFTKAHIVVAVAEGASQEAAARIADMKKPEMAQAAEQLLAGARWLPAVMRTPEPQAAVVEAETAPENAEPVEGVAGEAVEDDQTYAVAAE
jgi:ParB family chromosome partitioning protein